MATGSGSEQLSKADRKRMFSTTMAVIQEDPTDVRARLQLVDLLQQDGQTEQAVEELQRTAAVYVDRGVPIKAVAVLRQAVKLAPERPDVRVTYGEVFESLRMRDDAAREYRQAVELFHANGEHAAEVESLARLIALDDGNHGATIEVAEALHRVGRTKQACDLYRGLAERFLEAGATAEWEQLAERLCFLAPDDVTTAHDLALHYVRSHRYGEALAKLIACYEAEPNDIELFELVIETLEHLGQTQHAATLTRQLVARYRQGGLQQEASDALKRLHALDPDDEEARREMGVLAGAIADDSVLELQADEDFPSLDDFEDEEEDGEIGFGGDFVDRLLSSSGTQAPPILRNTANSGLKPVVAAAPPIPDAAPPIPVQSAPPLPEVAIAPPIPVAAAAPPIPVAAAAPPIPDDDIEPPTQMLEVVPVAASRPSAPRRPLRPSSKDLPPVPLRPESLANKSTVRARRGARTDNDNRPPPIKPRNRHPESVGFGPPPDDATELLDVSNPAASKPAATRVSLKKPGAKVPRRAPTGSAAAATPPEIPTASQSVAPPVPQVAASASAPVQATGAVRKPAVNRPAGPPTSAKHRHQDTSPNPPQQVVTKPAPKRRPQPSKAPTPAAGIPPAMPKPAAAPKAPTSTENANLFLLEEDEEQGFSGVQQDHTTIDPRVFEVLDRLDAKSGSGPRVATAAANPNPDTSPTASGSATDSEQSGRSLTSKRRSTKLPRPRLARGKRRGSSDSRRKRGIETDLKTLDFFIERGFYESAAALVGELEKRYPHSEELRARRRRIAQMARK